MRILRGVGSALLSCGCFVGLYETYSGPTVQIVEERGVSCDDPKHDPGVQVVMTATDLPRTPSAPPAQRPAA